MMHTSSDSDFPGLSAIADRERNTLREVGGLANLSEAQFDRHLLLVMLGQARIMLRAAESERDNAVRAVARRQTIIDNLTGPKPMYVPPRQA